VTDELTADTATVEDDPDAWFARTLSEGWGDGAPLIPPTDARIAAMLDATTRTPEEAVGELPPRFGTATVELIAINAVLAGVEPAAFGHVLAAVEATCRPDFNAFGVTTSTNPSCPMVIVNGPSRDRLGIDFRAGCLGGAAGRGSMTIGRAVSLCLRNIGGQRCGDTSRSVFGQPARFGLCFGEWEERSPWPSLAARRGFDAGDDVVTVHAGTATMHVYDSFCDDPADLAHLLGKSLAYPMSTIFHASKGSAEMPVIVNPLWARALGERYSSIEDFQQALWDQAWQPIEVWPEAVRPIYESRGYVTGGRVRLVDKPSQIVPLVCGGLGNLHGMILNSFGDTLMQTAPVEALDPNPG